MTRFLLSATAYPVIVFPLAILWHIGLFRDRYRAFGYFDAEPDIALGLVTIVAQGVIMAALFVRFSISGGPMRRALVFATGMGLFHWTCHVLAFLAKQSPDMANTFFVMETGYLTLQFGLYALALGAIHSWRTT